MKKLLLCGSVLSLMCATTYADNQPSAILTQPVAAQTTQPETTSANQNGQTTTDTTQPKQTTNPAVKIQTTTTTTTQTTQTPNQATTPTKTPTSPATTTSSPTNSTIQPTVVPAGQTTQTTTVPATVKPQVIDCNYRIPAETTQIEQALVIKWASKALQQSFDFDFNTIDQQLASLKNCYTDQGWQSFNDALTKSGNLQAIKAQKLMVSSMIDGQEQVIETKDNQWKITFPLQVVYQNDKEKLTQPLSVYLVIGRKITGDLGIMQMIASPRQITQQGTGTSTQTTTKP
ncbi:IcmL-like protein [Legionella birminghamensis]|uniref:IcmL-like protein n=1 Tax=Legionella birminghamensis TaxID=28083 RepID=A0A378I746_9GAMM|nr:DotI/IcmL family type IV secretion protein [Legionella birminghamensis]KTC68262.1 IcmL-like protein [Legionella birminghamensis]STX31027.1 IcmL-like protein [Legionella birminghamensis]